MALIAFIIAFILYALAAFDVHPKCVIVGHTFLALGFVILNWGNWPR